jgi:enamine deaminase RidA (YjgF/YER057c/UK114 family)
MRYADEGGWQEAAGYSRAVRRGGIITVSGTTAEQPGDTAAQTRECLTRVLAAISALGGTADDVVRTVVYLAPGASWEEAARVHREVMGDVRPANTMLYVASLIGGPYLVEVEAMAVVDDA